MLCRFLGQLRREDEHNRGALGCELCTPAASRAGTSDEFEGLAVVNAHQRGGHVIDIYTARGENDRLFRRNSMSRVFRTYQGIQQKKREIVFFRIS